MKLSRQTLGSIKDKEAFEIPSEEVFQLPERIVQFGTGVLLRGLPDYFVDKAIKAGKYDGRVVMIKSTDHGNHHIFEEQDCLYTLCVKGIEDGKAVDENIINAAISRIIKASEAWDEVLKCAENKSIELVVSNTTEVGIALEEEKIAQGKSPDSYPAKLLGFLYHRYQHFKGSAESGLVIIPSELLPDNGDKLLSIILKLADYNKLASEFVHWLKEHNYFCNSLVDRIVPGRLSKEGQQELEEKLGMEDKLTIMSEVYRLWAIETSSDKVKKVLRFSEADNGMILAPSINKFRELKLRLLNGTHTLSCGLAFLAGFKTVKDGMDDDYLSSFISHLMVDEIAPAITGDGLSYDEACAFSNSVLDRFRNPYLDHQWISITLQYTSKMYMRNVPLILRRYREADAVPAHMALGFAAYILFMKSEKRDDGKYVGRANGKEYVINDDLAAKLSQKWQDNAPEQVAKAVLSDEELWGDDLSALPGFSEAVQKHLSSFMEKGVFEYLKEKQADKISA